MTVTRDFIVVFDSEEHANQLAENLADVVGQAGVISVTVAEDVTDFSLPYLTDDGMVTGSAE